MRTEASVIALVSALVAAPVASAAPPRENYAAAITLDQLRSFAAAIAKLSEIEQSYRPRLAEAAGAEREMLRDRASNRMISAVRETGISVGTFNRIVAQTRHDESMARRVEMLVRQVSSH